MHNREFPSIDEACEIFRIMYESFLGRDSLFMECNIGGPGREFNRDFLILLIKDAHSYHAIRMKIELDKARIDCESDKEFQSIKKEYKEKMCKLNNQEKNNV